MKVLHVTHQYAPETTGGVESYVADLVAAQRAAGLEQDANGQAMLYFGADQGLITLTRDATLYLARSTDIGYRQLQDTPELLDRLALELQRSLDYYDRHFQQAPVASVTLCPLPQPVPGLAGQLEEQLGEHHGNRCRRSRAKSRTGAGTRARARARAES